MDNNSLLITNKDNTHYIILLITFILIVIFKKLIIGKLISIVLLFYVLYVYRSKFDLFMVVYILLCLIVLFTNNKENFEACMNDKKIIELINNINTNKLYYNYDYDLNKINETSWDIFLLANKNFDLKNAIKNKMVEIFRIIKLNKDLRNYLIFNNLINNEGYPLYINFSKEGYGDMLLLNEIKILLITSKIFKK